MRKLLILVCMLVLLPVTTTAQISDEEVWYFGHSKNTTLIAFNTTGQSNTLLVAERILSEHPQIRLNNEQVIVRLRVSGADYLYRLTPDEAILIGSGDYIASNPIAIGDGVAVIGGGTSQPAEAILHTVDDMRVLPNLMRAFGLDARFSEDSLIFRYIGVDANGQWGLWIHDVDTGEDNLIYVFGEEYPRVYPTTHGEYWLHRIENDTSAEYFVIQMDGQVESMGVFDESDSSYKIHVLETDLIVYPTECDTKCTVEARGIEDGIIRTYVGNPSVFHASPISFTPDGNLLVTNFDTYEFYLLRADAPPQFLGYNDARGNIFSQELMASSYDGRWVYPTNQLNRPNTFQVIDLLSGVSVAEYPVTERFALEGILQGDGMVAFNPRLRESDLLIYDAQLGDVEIRDLTNMGQAVDFLPNNIVLFDADTTVYLFDFDTNEQHILIEDGNQFRVMGFYQLDTR